ncbi:MAG TPA: TylF/MycF/NovP-related O-methyltransferase [Caulobacteraceae bacterium]|nr:TylF/MycF/NovP-related O-methyltransferase [Caulobacteraceae bacterium]
MGIRDQAARAAKAIVNSRAVIRRRFPDLAPETLATYERVKRFTMTTPERVAALCDAVRYVDANGIAGAIVECGVYRGGSAMAAALTCTTGREIWLYDTFEGMSAPTADDARASDGRAAAELLDGAAKGELIWCYSSEAEVAGNMRTTGHPEALTHLVKGKVEDTIPGACPDQIAVLRLDTDWYESTRHELEHLYPRLAPGGVLIIDDYGYWAGARKAVDEYFGGSLFLSRIDGTGRIAVKPGAAR